MNTLKITLLLINFCLLSVCTGFAQEEEPPQVTLITNVNVWDGISDDKVAADVLIENNMITQVGANITPPSGATIVDGNGGTLIPGLIDMHSHIGLREGLLEGVNDWDAYAMGALSADNCKWYLDQGFTSARDTGSPTEGIAKLIKLGRLDGPRIYTSGGWVSQTSGHADVGGWNHEPDDLDAMEQSGAVQVADGVPAVIQAVRRNLRKGATQIKLMAGGGVSSEWDPISVTQYSFDEMKAAVEAAADWGTYVTVHAYHDRSVNRAIDAGVKCIEHCFLVTEPTVKRMADEGVALSLQGFMSYTVFANPEEITFFTADQKEKAKLVHEGVVNLAKWAKKYNVHIVTGADMFGTPYGHMLAENVIVEKELGFSNLEILKHSTSNAAVLLQQWTGGLDPYMEGKLGVIAPGSYADLIVIDGDPLQDIEVLRDYRNNFKLIIKDGKVWKNTLGS